MEIKFEEQNLPSNVERNISLSVQEGDSHLVVFTSETIKNEYRPGVPYFMDKQQLSDYIGALLHFQSKLKRGV